MSENKKTFQVGDEVRCINDDCWFNIKGEVVTVEKIDFSPHAFWFKNTIHERHEFSVGDNVCVLKQDYELINKDCDECICDDEPDKVCEPSLDYKYEYELLRQECGELKSRNMLMRDIISKLGMLLNE